MLDGPPNGLEIAKHPVGEPPGQLLKPILDSIRRSWPGRLHRVVRQPGGMLAGHR